MFNRLGGVMFKICAVGLMRNRLFVIREIEVYFWHLNNPVVGSGFQRKTILGKMMAGDVGGSRPGSSVPKGIKMSDSEYLCSINRMDLAMVALKSHDVFYDAHLWDFIHARYRHRLSYMDLSDVFDKSRATLCRWNTDALVLISNKIC